MIIRRSLFLQLLAAIALIEKTNKGKVLVKENDQIGDRAVPFRDRVYVKSYSCLGTEAKVEWREELKLTDNLSIPSAYVYWVELEVKIAWQSAIDA